MSSSARAELGDEPNARESRPPSPSRPSTFNERVIISYVLSRQGDLEKQIEALHLRKYRDASRLRGVDCKTRSQRFREDFLIDNERALQCILD